MNLKTLNSAVGVLSLLVLGLGNVAQAQGPVHFNGSIHDYTSSSVSGGPWEFHGPWTLDVRPASGKADFSLDMTMSNYGTTGTGAVDPTKPGQTPHVHHVVLKNANVQWNMDGCPTFPAPQSNNFGFQVTGQVSLLTGNGAPAHFDPAPPQSQLTVCITGVTGEAGAVSFSNITLQFGAPANTHFGVGTVIHGLVANTRSELGEDWHGDHR